MSEPKRTGREAQRILAKELRRLAFERDIEGPYKIADYIREWAEKNDWPEKLPERATIADYMSGRKGSPSAEFIELFTAAFALTAREETDLAWANTFPFSVAA